MTAKTAGVLQTKNLSNAHSLMVPKCPKVSQIGMADHGLFYMIDDSSPRIFMSHFLDRGPFDIYALWLFPMGVFNKYLFINSKIYVLLEDITGCWGNAHSRCITISLNIFTIHCFLH